MNAGNVGVDGERGPQSGEFPKREMYRSSFEAEEYSALVS